MWVKKMNLKYKKIWDCDFRGHDNHKQMNLMRWDAQIMIEIRGIL